MLNKLKKLKVGTVCLLVVALIIAGSFIGQLNSIRSLNKEMSSLVQQKQTKLTEQADLKNEIQLLSTNAFIEKLARENLGMIKPGEQIYVPTVVNSDVKEQIEITSIENEIH